MRTLERLGPYVVSVYRTSDQTLVAHQGFETETEADEFVAKRGDRPGVRFEIERPLFEGY